MLFRETGGTAVAIPQPSHAWLSGQAMRAWGNAEFGVVTPAEDVCLAAEQHDIGWLTWEQAPTLNPATGRPHSFRELGVAQHTATWSQGSAMALAFGRYPALLVSLHGAGLYRNFDLASADPDAADVVHDFLRTQAQLQQRLTASLAADRHYAPHVSAAAIERNRRLVSAADRLSIAICTGLRDIAVSADVDGEGWIRDVPTVRAMVDIRIRALDAGRTRFVLNPWPFAEASARLTCEGVALPHARFADETAMRSALREGRSVVVAAELTPDDRPPA
jgi:Protein of unknown function (DUF3891)